VYLMAWRRGTSAWVDRAPADRLRLMLAKLLKARRTDEGSGDRKSAGGNALELSVKKRESPRETTLWRPSTLPLAVPDPTSPYSQAS